MLDWNAIDTVLLDMDGTLLDLHFDNYFWRVYLAQRYSKLHGVAHAEASDLLHERFEATAGTLEWYCLDYWSRELQLDILQLKQEIEHLIAVHPYVEEFLGALMGRKRLILVTNAHPGSLRLKLNRTGIERYFDQVVSSHHYRLPKEDVSFWQGLQQHLQFDPGRTLLVEDNQAVLSTARDFGIAQLIAITQPDSRGAVVSGNEFLAIKNFGELLLSLNESKP